MILKRFTQQPNERKDYDIDVAPWLAPGDTIDTVASWAVCLTDPLDTSLTIDTTQYTVDRVKVWVEGGVHGRKYKITVAVTTVEGRVDESELIFTIKEI